MIGFTKTITRYFLVTSEGRTRIPTRKLAVKTGGELIRLGHDVRLIEQREIWERPSGKALQVKAQWELDRTRLLELKAKEREANHRKKTMTDPKVTRIEKRIEPFTFWRLRCIPLTDNSTYRQPVIGSIGFVTEIKPSGRIEVLISETNEGFQSDSSKYYEEAEFWYCFEEIAEGEKAVDDLIEENFSKAQTLKDDLKKLNTKTESMEDAFAVRELPNVDHKEIRELSDGEININEEPESGEMALTIVEKLDRVGQADNIREHLADTAKTMERKHNAIAKCVSASKALMSFKFQTSAAMCQVKNTVTQLEKVMVTLNLYLGADEDILQIKMGDWSPEGTPLTVRQLVLFMDEESLIAAEDDKPFDFKNVYEFDDWLMDPENLNQVLPEERGIVCLKPRRKDVKYSDDPRHNFDLNEENRRTYFLIRNGENLFRIVPSWSVGEKLFPSSKEMEDCFTVTRWRGPSEGDETYTAKAGTSDFDDAMKKFDKKATHYRNTLTLIQGIVDRTGIFPDLQAAGVNVLNVAENKALINYINDAEEGFLLRDGKPTFREWQKEVNSKLKRGCRVMLFFRMWDEETERHKGIGGITPVDEWDVNTITSEKGKTINIGIRRLVWDRENSRSWDKEYIESKTRGVITLERDNEFILAYDLASTELFSHFLSDRLSRENYRSMLPLIKHIRRQKREEEKEEKPIRDLISAQIMKREDITIDQANSKAQEKLNWWKFKTIKHRSITQDVDKAVRMIMKEMDSVDKTQEYKEVYEKAREEIIDENTIMCFRKGPNRYYVWEHAFEDSRIWVNQKIYKYVFKRFELESEGGINPAYKPVERNIIFQKAEEVKVYPVLKKDDIGFLSRNELLSVRREFAENLIEPLSTYNYGGEFKVYKVFPIRFFYDRIQSYNYYDDKKHWKHNIYATVVRFGIKQDGNPSIEIKECFQRVNRDGLYNQAETTNRYYRGGDFEDSLKKIEDADYSKPYIPGSEPMHLAFDYSVFPAIRLLSGQIELYKDAREKIETVISEALEAKQTRIEKKCEEKAKREYLDKKGDPRNWDAYKKRRGFDTPSGFNSFVELSTAIMELVYESGADSIADKSFKMIYDQLPGEVDALDSPDELFSYLEEPIFFGEKLEIVKKEYKRLEPLRENFSK